MLRRRAGLTQADLAFLLGARSHTTVSRLERGQQVPDGRSLVILELVFGVAPSGVFPALRERIEAVVAARIEKLVRVSERESSAQSLSRPSVKAIHLNRVLEAMRRRDVPGLNVHKPWPKAKLVNEEECPER